MNLNQIKRFLRRFLPKPIFNSIQRIRSFGYQPPATVNALRTSFEQLQGEGAEVDIIRIRPEIKFRAHSESIEAFTWFCWRSPEMVAELDFFISRIQGVKSFADIGASHGIFSLVFLKVNPEGKVLSVDPSPLAHEIRKTNRDLNEMESNLICQQVACGAEEGTVNMHFNWHHLEVSGKGDEGLETVQIQVKSLDTLCRESAIHPDIVKIDVEGFELQVLQGAEATLKSTKLLLLEIHPELLDKLNISLVKIFDWLDQRGWQIQTLHGKLMTRSEFCDQIHNFWTVCEH